MTEYPSSTPEEAANPLGQAETTLIHTRGNMGWSTIVAQMNVGAAISVYLLTSRDTQFDTVSFIDMTVWVLVPLILVVAFAKVAENDSEIRRSIYMVVWVLCWSTSMFFPTAVVRVPLAAAIAVVPFVGAPVETRR